MYTATMIEKMDSIALRKHKGISFVGVTVSFVCYDKTGQVFMAKRSKNARDEHGKWDGGGGGLKHGDTLENTVRREILEEYGADVLQLDYLGHFEAFRTNEAGQKTHWIAHCYAALVDHGRVRIMEPEIFDDSGWFDLDALPEPLHSQWVEKFLPLYGKKLRKIITP